jgi:hypothetical protein
MPAHVMEKFELNLSPIVNHARGHLSIWSGFSTTSPSLWFHQNPANK